MKITYPYFLHAYARYKLPFSKPDLTVQVA